MIRRANRDYGLQVHQIDRSQAKDTLAIFIHGLGGGAKGTWGRFPELIASDSSFPADYAFFDYLSFYRRFFRRTPSLWEVVRYMIDQIRATQYRRVVLIGHSMGGNLARAAVQYIYEMSLRNSREYIHVQGIILFASPMLGSSYYVTQMTKDGRLVAAYSEDLNSILHFFHDRVDSTIDAPRSDRINIPMFAAIAQRDRYVRPMSAQELAPDLQTRRIDATHKGIVKPENRDSVSYTWLTECLSKCINHRYIRLRPAEDTIDRIFSRYTGSGKHADWQDKYLAACARVEESDGVTIVDTQDGEYAVNVSICVVEDQEIIENTYTQLIMDESLAQVHDNLMSLYIGAIGEDHGTATDYIEHVLAPLKAGIARYYTGLPDANTLEETISNWLHSVCARKRQSFLRQPSLGVENDYITGNKAWWS